MPHIPDLAAHATHDPALIAAHAAGDAAGAELATATALVAACPSCAALHRDLRAIAAAVADLPAPTRSRDFRITPEAAASLRPAGWRGLLGALAGPRFSFAAPLGTGLATLGLATILLGSVAGLPLGAGGAATGDDTARGAAQAGAAAEMASAAPSAADKLLVQGEPVQSLAAVGDPQAAAEPAPVVNSQPPAEGVTPMATGAGQDPRMLLAIAALILGLTLVAGRVIAKRLVRAG